MQEKFQHTSLSISDLDLKVCARVVENVCNSSELRRSARLKDFLHFVSQRALKNPGEVVTEQEIGVKVFERHSDYDTGVDNIVRVNASELRKRVATYFATVGANEPVVFDIPRGSYTPRFSSRTNLPPAEIDAAIAMDDPPAELVLKQPSFSRKRIAWFAIAALAMLSAFLAYQLWAARQASDPWRSEPTTAKFWSGVLDGPRSTDIVLADTSFALVEDLLGRQVSLDHYLNRTYLSELEHSDLPPELKTRLLLLVSRSNGSIGDFGAARRILSLAPHSDRVVLAYARTLAPPALKTDNLILVGSSYSNPWTSLFEPRLNFVVSQNESDKRMVVRNRKPLAGELVQYETQPQTVESIGYSVVASIAGEDGRGEVIVIEGTSAEATEAAGEFLTSEKSLRQLSNSAPTVPLRHFEVLLQTTKLAGTPLSAKIVASRFFQ